MFDALTQSELHRLYVKISSARRTCTMRHGWTDGTTKELLGLLDDAYAAFAPYYARRS